VRDYPSRRSLLRVSRIASGLRASGLTPPTAQCLYVLTDDNPPIADEIRANFSYVSSLLEIAKAAPALQDLKGKHPTAEERSVALGILACGKFGSRERAE
jgi:hypothetical protein